MAKKLAYDTLCDVKCSICKSEWKDWIEFYNPLRPIADCYCLKCKKIVVCEAHRVPYSQEVEVLKDVP